jgi:hypothetical protein
MKKSSVFLRALVVKKKIPSKTTIVIQLKSINSFREHEYFQIKSIAIRRNLRFEFTDII